MSSSSRKYYYYNTTKWEYTATNGGGRSSRNAAKNNSTAPKETTRTTPMQAKKEKPLSKLHDLLSYGVKPWDPDADDFYEALQEARRKMDAQQDQDDSKTDSLTGRNHTNSKREGADTKAGGSSSRNYGKNENNNKVPKATTISVNEQAEERPMSKFEDLLTYGIKPWDSDADDFYEALQEARKKMDAQQDQDDSKTESLPRRSYTNSKWEGTDSKSGGSSSRKNGKSKNNNKIPKATTISVNEQAKERPMTKFEDLLTYGVKPWDSDADDFYEALQEARKKMDAHEDQDDSKTGSLNGRNYTNRKWEGTDIKSGGSSSRNNGKTKNNNKAPKATTISVNEQANERPMSKFEDLLTYGVKPWDSEDADDFYEAFLKARGKFESCQIEDHEFEAWEYQDSEIQLWQDEDSEVEPWQDENSENSEIELWEDEDSVDSEIELWEDEDEDSVDSKIEPWEEDEDSD